MTTVAPPPAIVAEAPAAVPVLPAAPPPVSAWKVQSAVESLAQDAGEYARMHDVGIDEAMRRLRAQQESVAATDRIAADYRDRLTGISIEHAPVYRIVVLLAGDAAVADSFVAAGGMTVPIVFRTGAAATRDALLAAADRYRTAMGKIVPGPFGVGVDARTGELVVTVKGIQAQPDGAPALSAELAAITGVPVRVRVMDRPGADLSATGGSRVEGIVAETGRRAACTTGFVVTDLARSGIVTAAHCPYTLVYRDPSGERVPLSFVGAWGARYQDVQIQVSGEALPPLFFADSAKRAVRPVTSWRNRASTRAGDVVCHRGEKTGYSCAEVELVDYAPPGDLCGGPCEAKWVTVAGPSCGAGDSGGPVFAGTIAFGILKGGSYRRDGSCSFYYYMSTDYLPSGWSLLHAAADGSAMR